MKLFPGEIYLETVETTQAIGVSASRRIIADFCNRRGFKENYWEINRFAKRLTRLVRSENRAFGRWVIKDSLRFLLNGVRPVQDETKLRIEAAVQWLLRAQNATADDGVALGYFPCDEPYRWWRSYPETTGYIITSLLGYSRRYENQAASSRALRMAQWEIEIQMPNGAVQGGPVCRPEEQTACAFNTGMVLDGLVSAYEWTKESDYLIAARRAGEFLLSDLREDGYFKTNGQFVAPGVIKTYNCLCAWALYRLGDCMDGNEYRRAAVRAVDAALRQQQTNGWFANNCLTRPEAPLLHTIGYTLQGILEVGILAKREDFIAAAQRGAEPLLARISPKGFLAGRFYSDWQPAVFSSCLTGSAQLAGVLYRLYEHTSIEKYRDAADRLVNFLKPLQALGSGCEEIDGALPGSFPLFGEYMTAGYPNWATKYLLDALILQERYQK